MNALSPVALPLVQGLLVFLIVGLGLALVVGALLLTKPRLLFALNAWLSRWVDTRGAFGVLDEPHHLERFFYRHHRILGLVIVAGAGYVLWRWAFHYERADLLALLGPRFVSRGLDWVPAALETTLVTLHGAILMIGALVFFRPSLLKGFERTANHWQPGPATTPLDAVIGNLDGAFEGHPRVSGLLLVVSAFWCLLALAPFVVDILAR